MQGVIDYLKQNESRFVSELCEYVRFPSVSAQPQHRSDMQACAGWVVEHAGKSAWRRGFASPPGTPLWSQRRPVRKRRGHAVRTSWFTGITMCSRPNRWTCGSLPPLSHSSPTA